MLVIFDLNGVLVERNRKNNSFQPVPEMLTILIDALENHKVAIWSSARKSNVKWMLNAILSKDAQKNLLFIWCQKDCGIEENPDKPYPLFTKNLTKVWEQFPDYDENNTFIVDDTKKKLKNNPEHTGFIPEEFYAKYKSL